MPFDDNLLKRLRENDPALVDIYLPNQDPKLTPKDIEALVNALQTNTYLTSLSLADNDIGDQGAILLSQHTNLMMLDISSNNVSDEGIKALAKLPNLKSLYCANNYGITHTGIEALIENKNISDLLIDYIFTHPIHVAVYHDRLDWVQTLFKHNTSVVNQQNCKGETALLMATAWSRLNIIRWLIQNTGASLLDHSSDKENILTLVAQNNHLTLLEYFLNQDVQPLLNAPNMQGNTPLMCAAENGFQSIAECLIKAGACVTSKNHQGDMAILLAAENGHLAMVEYLMTFDDFLPCGERILTKAIQSGNLLLVKKLITAGITLDRSEFNERGYTIVSCWVSEGFIEAIKYQHMHVAHYFQTLGAKIDAYNSDGFSALYFAIKNNDVPTVKWLIDHGCSLDEYVAKFVEYFFDGNPYYLKKPTPLDYKLNLAYNDFWAPPPYLGQDVLFNLLLSETLRLTQRKSFAIPLGVLSPKQMTLYAEKLYAHPFIKTIQFTYIDYYQYQQREVILRILSSNSLLTEVELNFDDSRYDYNDMSLMKDYLFFDIATLLRYNPNLQKLNLVHVPSEFISSETIPLLCALEDNQTLLELNFYSYIPEVNNNEDEHAGVADDNFLPLAEKLEPYLRRNRASHVAQSLAELTNILRNTHKKNLPLDPKLPQLATTIASLQGYCTFFARKLGITAKRDDEQQWQAYFNNQALPIPSILAEAIATKAYEKIVISSTQAFIPK